MYEVNTSNYTGPLEKLLELIEAKQFEITTVSLAEVTADFLNYVRSLEKEKVEPRVLADFLVVAAKLILIKSKVLLPNLELTDEEEGEIHDLEHRLKLYQEFKRAGQHVDSLWRRNKRLHSRSLFLHLGEARVFYPPDNLSPTDLHNALRKLLVVIQEFVPERKKITTTIVTLGEKVQELLERLKEAATQSFKNLSRDKSRTELVILFLAMLQMFRQRVIEIEQPEQFGDIIISKSEPMDDSARLVTENS
jgi:segregation and condensation protein A